MTCSRLDLFINPGVAIVLARYRRLQSGRTSLDAIGCRAAKAAGVGAGLILVSPGGNFNLAAFAVAGFRPGVSGCDTLRLPRARSDPAN